MNGLGLYLSGNNKLLTSKCITDIDVVVLFKILKSTSIFVVINLSYNNLGDKAAEAIAQYLEVKTKVFFSSFLLFFRGFLHLLCLFWKNSCMSYKLMSSPDHGTIIIMVDQLFNLLNLWSVV